jgi:hypothetical protein
MRFVKLISATEEITNSSVILDKNEVVFDLDTGYVYMGDGFTSLNVLSPLISSVGGGSSYPSVANFDALPLASAHPQDIYITLNSQGTRWLPGSLGGTYYSKGFYYSDGSSWSYLGSMPNQATQEQVTEGLSTDTFVSPATLSTSLQSLSMSNVTVDNFPVVQPVNDNGGSLTVDGTVALIISHQLNPFQDHSPIQS